MKTIHAIQTLLLLAASGHAQELAELRASDAGARDLYGATVALDAGTLAVGATRNDENGGNSGAAYVYTGQGASWSEQAFLTPQDAKGGDQFGTIVSLSGDSLLVTAHGDDLIDNSNNNEGSAYVFVRNGGVWSEQAKLVAPDAAFGDLFGLSAAIDADTVAIGVPYDDDAGSESGSVHVFVRVAGSWSHQAKLTASVPDAGDRFGGSLALHGETLLIGSPRDDDGGLNAGAAFVFVRNGGVWSEQTKLVAQDTAPEDAFGESVGLEGDTAVVGAFKSDDKGLNAGSAYVFTRSGSVWTEAAELTASDTESFDGFGGVVALDQGTLLVGASGAEGAGRSSGAAYVFSGSGVSWSEDRVLVPFESAGADFAGSAVAVSGTSAVIGAGWDDDDGVDSGSAHVFSTIPPPGSGYCGCDGSGTAAPCGNSGAAGRGCANGTYETGCQLSAMGQPSVAADTLMLVSFDSTPGQPGLYFQGDNAMNGGAGFTFGDGLRCAGDNVRRLEVVVADGAGQASSNIGIAAATGLSAGDVRRYQLWYRDPAGSLCGATFNLSNGFEVTWLP